MSKPSPELLTRAQQNLLARADLRECAFYFAGACQASRLHLELASEALTQYGEHGPQVSGIVRDHFPDPIKGKLRFLARAVAWKCEQAWARRPKGIRRATMQALAHAVARRDGSGFYGPQPGS